MDHVCPIFLAQYEVMKIAVGTHSSLIRGVGGAVRSRPLEGLAALLTSNLVVLTRRIPKSVRIRD
jgi:hypothetical protein